MKKLFSFFIALLFIYIAEAQNVGIGTNSPNVSAILELKDTTKGFLPPRMTIVQRNAISSPVAGLILWCSTCGFSGELQVYNGAVWTTLTGGTASVIIPSDTICNQIWMLKNLEVTTYRNGDPIPQVTDATAWANLTTGAWCWYNNDPAIGATYGKLYNWYAVNDPRGLAPSGWHIPSDAEWITLSTCLGGDPVAGGAMKEIGTTHWTTPNEGATNSSGFTGLPAGYRNYSGSSGGPLGYIGEHGYWWSSTPVVPLNANALSRVLSYIGYNIATGANEKHYGFSVRCLRD